jgi:hypothetical protein
MHTIKFREHRGWLDESMKTTREVTSEEDLLKALNDIYDPFEKVVSSLLLKKYGYDERNWWDTYMVLAQFEWESNDIPVWFTNWTFGDALTTSYKNDEEMYQS